MFLILLTCATSLASASFLETIVRNVNEAAGTADCPCAAENSWCNYAPLSSPCPRANVCHGSTTPCDCDSCPTTGSSCTGCNGPSPGPSPGPTPGPSPQPGAWCEHPSDCQSDEICCLCNCDFGDAALGDFGCNCDAKGKAKPNSDQPHCCGGQSGLEAWCAKAGTPSFANPKCNSTSTIFGVSVNMRYECMIRIVVCVFNCTHDVSVFFPPSFPLLNKTYRYRRPPTNLSGTDNTIVA